MADDTPSSRQTASAATAATQQDWEAAVATVFKKSGRFKDGDDPASAARLLVKKTPDGVAIPPLAGTEVARNLRGSSTGAAATRGVIDSADRAPGDVPSWDLRIAVASSGRTPAEVEDELTGGGASLWITAREGAVALDRLGDLLSPVLLDIAPVVLDSDQPLSAAETLIAAAKSQNVTLHPHTNLGADPTGELLLTGTATLDDQVGPLAKSAQANGIRGFVVDATVVHDAGAGEVLELAYAAATGVALLRQLDEAGIAPSDAAGLIEFRYAATDQQFTTIAKLRAARAVWARICDVLEITDDVQRQHVVTSQRMMTRFDPYTNLLRTTIATFAAAVGGAESITVQPFDSSLGESDGFSRRIARNISNLLVHESHVGQVADPAGGSGSIESLTNSLAEASWTKFAETEKAGGIREVIASGALASEVSEAWQAREKQIDTRKLAITGVSEFPLADETVLERRSAYNRFGSRSLLTQVHDADGFEELRLTPCTTPMFLVPIGPVAAHTARSSFAINLLTAGGIPVANGVPLSDTTALIEQYRSSGAAGACLVGSDAGYAELGPDTIGALRQAGIDFVVAAGKPVPEIADLIDDYMAVGQDVIDFLRRTRSTLEGTAK
ncbi:methylmalonyl-CoA mutase family protein [Antricoccus suffuscus]|nr:methylmalonyl-CoA mutase family protein [Antricoccus suffuscus]